jgi:hypothetical protein
MSNLSKKRKHSLTGKKARIRTERIWPQQLSIILLTIFLCFVFFYKVYDAGKITRFLLKIAELESINKEYEKSLLETRLEIQMGLISYDKLAQEVKAVKQENTGLKEDNLFYEKIVGKRPK